MTRFIAFTYLLRSLLFAIRRNGGGYEEGRLYGCGADR